MLIVDVKQLILNITSIFDGYRDFYLSNDTN